MTAAELHDFLLNIGVEVRCEDKKGPTPACICPRPDRHDSDGVINEVLLDGTGRSVPRCLTFLPAHVAFAKDDDQVEAVFVEVIQP